MRQIKFIFQIMLFALFAGLSSCSSDDIQIDDLEINNQSTGGKEALDFVAQLTPIQLENMESSGNAFLPEQQKDSWNTVIANDIPATWGTFDSPFKQSRAVGIWGSYPAQYWTMVRVKVENQVPIRLRDQLNEAAKEIEANTNVRFYNSQEDNKYYESGNIKIELPNVILNMYSNNSKIEGSGSFGLIGGEQKIYCSYDLDNEDKYTDDEVKAFLMHALCNAAGMFNEQQRKDRDSYVKIYDENIKDNCKPCFTKQDKNYTMNGTFDYNSITIASSYSYSKNGKKTIEKIGNGEIPRNDKLSSGDIYFLNQHYLPYIARTDNYVQLDKRVWMDGRLLTEQERIQLQNNLNAQRGLYGTPPESGEIKQKPW